MDRGGATRVLTKAEVRSDREQRGTDKMHGSAGRKDNERICEKFDRATEDPDTDDEEQGANRHRPDLALGKDEPQAQCQVAHGAEHQQ